MSEVVWFHGGSGGYRAGRVLRGRGRTKARALNASSGGKSRVYVTTNPWAAWQYATIRRGSVYEVQPLGRLRRDAESPQCGWTCSSALVVSEFMRPSRSAREQMESLWQAARVRAGTQRTDDIALAAVAEALREIVEGWGGEVPRQYCNIPAPLALPYIAGMQVEMLAPPDKDCELRPWVECAEPPERCGVERCRDPYDELRCGVCGLSEAD
jgi:hypothetical protein